MAGGEIESEPVWMWYGAAQEVELSAGERLRESEERSYGKNGFP